MEQTIVNAIQEFIKMKRDEEHILNVIVRDDVFSILEEKCQVLYYALDDDIDGCHICKSLNGELRQFVYIHTSKVLQEQVSKALRKWGTSQRKRFRYISVDLMPVRIFMTRLFRKINIHGWISERMYYKSSIWEKFAPSIWLNR